VVSITGALSLLVAALLMVVAVPGWAFLSPQPLLKSAAPSARVSKLLEKFIRCSGHYF
jgi:hypothetical protein